MNLCKDCKHFRPQITLMGGEAVLTSHPKCAISVEPVYGGRMACDLERTRSHDCGPEGKNYEARPTGEKNYEMTFWVSKDQVSGIAVEKDLA